MPVTPINFLRQPRKTWQRTRTSLRHVWGYTANLLQGDAIPGRLSVWTRDTPPLVLTHGFLGNRGTMQPLSQRFHQDGRITFSYHHGHFQLASLRASAEQLMAHLTKLEQTLGIPQFDVVGFSMGGLVALHAVKFLQGHQLIRRLALLGSPVGGTWLGLLGVATLGCISMSVWQCLPPSRFLRDLREAPLPQGIRVRQIQADHDVLSPLAPPIAGVDVQKDYVVLPGGHSSLVIDPAFYESLREFFAEP